MDPRANAFILEYRRQREALLAEYPELEEDAEALTDTLDGITLAPDLIAEFVRDAQHDEAMVEALSTMIRNMTDRKSPAEQPRRSSPACCPQRHERNRASQDRTA